ncbi:GIY-YIG nuclease family protein [Candidatus Pelagibacter sp.]|nr:GIY-YIG nuclease family protein [Candidatus Pelagibacter sp.]
MYYYVYMLKSITPGIKKTYVGYTNNVKLRIEKHNNNKGAKSTKGYKWLLIYSKKFKSKNNAMSFEYKLKKNQSERKKILEKFYNENINFTPL